MAHLLALCLPAVLSGAFCLLQPPFRKLGLGILVQVGKYSTDSFTVMVPDGLPMAVLPWLPPFPFLAIAGALRTPAPRLIYW